MRKKLLRISLVCCLLIMSCALFVACGGDPEPSNTSKEYTLSFDMVYKPSLEEVQKDYIVLDDNISKGSFKIDGVNRFDCHFTLLPGIRHENLKITINNNPYNYNVDDDWMTERFVNISLNTVTEDTTIKIDFTNCNVEEVSPKTVNNKELLFAAVPQEYLNSNELKRINLNDLNIKSSAELVNDGFYYNSKVFVFVKDENPTYNDQIYLEQYDIIENGTSSIGGIVPLRDFNDNFNPYRVTIGGEKYQVFLSNICCEYFDYLRTDNSGIPSYSKEHINKTFNIIIDEKNIETSPNTISQIGIKQITPFDEIKEENIPEDLSFNNPYVVKLNINGTEKLFYDTSYSGVDVYTNHLSYIGDKQFAIDDETEINNFGEHSINCKYMSNIFNFEIVIDPKSINVQDFQFTLYVDKQKNDIIKTYTFDNLTKVSDATYNKQDVYLLQIAREDISNYIKTDSYGTYGIGYLEIEKRSNSQDYAYIKVTENTNKNISYDLPEDIELKPIFNATVEENKPALFVKQRGTSDKDYRYMCKKSQIDKLNFTLGNLLTSEHDPSKKIYYKVNIYVNDNTTPIYTNKLPDNNILENVEIDIKPYLNSNNGLIDINVEFIEKEISFVYIDSLSIFDNGDIYISKDLNKPFNEWKNHPNELDLILNKNETIYYYSKNDLSLSLTFDKVDPNSNIINSCTDGDYCNYLNGNYILNGEYKIKYLKLDSLKTFIDGSTLYMYAS